MSRMRAGLEIEVVESAPEELHVYPRESRRGKAQWAIWIKPDGSAILFVGQQQIVLPKNAANVSGLHLYPQTNPKTGQIEFVSDSRTMCKDSACSLKGFTEHEFGKGCRLF